MLSVCGMLGAGSGGGFALPSFRVEDFADFFAAGGGRFAMACFLAVFFMVRRVWFGLRDRLRKSKENRPA